MVTVIESIPSPPASPANIARIADGTAVDSSFEDEIGRLREWRGRLTALLERFKEWAEERDGTDLQKSLKIFELIQSLKQGRMQIAFVAEVSRGKSELINALFFARYGQRVLPSGVGRTTMCPTEIFHDPTQDPYLALLPIETRGGHETLESLKARRIDWSRIRLPLDDVDALKEALQSLAQTKVVSRHEALILGLLGSQDIVSGEEDRPIEVPAWRYAQLNYPHPLLSNGLAILDTPGLNALGVEPELTLSALPNAHAVVFVLGVDTGVTKSDLDIWSQLVPSALTERVAVINKVDLLDDRPGVAPQGRRDIDRLVEHASSALGLRSSRVFALSARQALDARVAGDADAERKSGIRKLESYLAHHVAPMQRELIARAVLGEIGGMLAAARVSCLERLRNNDEAVKALNDVMALERKEMGVRWGEFAKLKEEFNGKLAYFKDKRMQLKRLRDDLGEILNLGALDSTCRDARTAIASSWTTVGLSRGMRELMSRINAKFSEVTIKCGEIDRFVSETYRDDALHKEGPPRRPERLTLDSQVTRLNLLEMATETFCRDPANVVLTEKSFMIERFWNTLVEQAHSVYLDARRRTEQWMAGALLPLEAQAKIAKEDMERWVQLVTKLQERTATLNGEMSRLSMQRNAILRELRIATDLRGELDEACRTFAQRGGERAYSEQMAVTS